VNCAEARKNLYPSPGQSALTIDTAKSMEHLKHCQTCRDYFAAQADWSRILREKLGTEPMPESLQRSIAGQIEQQQRKQRTTRLWAPAWTRIAIVILVVVALSVAWATYYRSSQQMFRALCEDHARYLDARSQVSSSDPNALESWFREKMGFGVRVPVLGSTELLGGRLCFLRERKAALVFYRKGDRTVSLFQFNGQGVSLRVLNRAEIDGDLLWRMSFKGYSLAAFEHRGIIFALVSDLRESELLELASAAQVRAKGY
jgi:anti-sigma factor RsiW